MNLAYTNAFFSVEHCDDCGIAGHLIIRPLTPVTTLADLPDAALEILGKTLALCYSAINKVINPARIYTLSFCEVLPALHFHVFPRTESLTIAYNNGNNIKNGPVNGALFFDWARKYCASKGKDYLLLQENINKEFL
jgi:diadenosine tetraphosphate (Ap4A) HIT family hydrolase